MTAMRADPHHDGQVEALSDRSTGDLVKLAAEQVSRLVRDELRLAQTELTAKGKRVGVGLGLFGGAGAFAFYGLGALLAAAVLGLAVVWPAWLAAVVVGVAVFAVAGVLALIGKGQVAKAAPAAPTETVNSVKADIDTIAVAAKEGIHR
jgi:uncharacterized membrane protein YqjE